MATTNPRADAAHALAVYAESFADGRRVAVFGETAQGVGEWLVQLGARTVAEIGPADDTSATRSRSFELALVLDTSAFDEPAELLATVRRLLTDDGLAIVSSGEALDYYALFDLVAAHFEDVRMVAQLPFRGLALVELGRAETPSVTVDTQLVDPDRSPDTFVAVASRRVAGLDPYAIVELPPDDEAQRVEVAEDIYATLAEAKLQAKALEAELAELRPRAVASRQLEDGLAVQLRAVAALQAALEEERAEAEEGRAAVARIEEAELRVVHAERAAAALEAELARLSHAHLTELERFEGALRDRAQAIRALEAELVRRERMIRELVDSLEQRPEPLPDRGELAPQSHNPTLLTDELARENSILRWRLDALAMELARRDAEAQAGEWAIQELEHELAREAENYGAETPRQDEAPTTPPEPADTDAARRLIAVLDEVDALRVALTQEHAARLRAESGEELVWAREEIQRKTVLLEQLARQLEAGGPPREELR